jgi:hypothetical protein
MNPLHKLGKYYNLDKLNKIVELIYSFTTFSTRAKHNWLNNPLDLFDSYSLWWTLGVEWHVDDIVEDRKYSIILVVQSDNYELYASTIDDNTLGKLLKTDYFSSINKRIDNLLVCRKDTQRLIVKSGDILLLDTSCYHKLENTKKTEDPFMFINLDIDFIPKIKEAIKVVNYFVYDFFVTIDQIYD